MAFYNGDISTKSASGRWEQFCKIHAQSSARHFAREFRQFVTDNPVYDIPSAPTTFSKRFLEYFLETFDTEVHKNILVDFGDPESPIDSFPPDDWGFHLMNPPTRPLHGPVAALEEETVEHSNTKFNVKSFTKKKFKNVKGFLKRTNSDGIKENRPLPHIEETPQFPSAPVVRRESVMSFLVNLENGVESGEFYWQKCRMILVKAPGGYMLEFYTPPKSHKPKSGIFCFLIHEARPATSLEMPDGDNVFVIKAVNKKEFMLAAADHDEMNSWLRDIHDCMEEDQCSSTGNTPVEKNAPQSFPPPEPLRVDLPPERQTSNTQDISHIVNSNTTHMTLEGKKKNIYQHPLVLPNNMSDDISQLPPPEVPPRSPTVSGGTPPGESIWLENTMLTNGDNDEIESEDTTPVIDWTNDHHPLAAYPWYHGTLPRIEASHLVGQGGNQWHGIFLVRASESRRGEYVLTFNFQGRAKHLRLSLNTEGQCRVQHLWFDSIFEMLEHFRNHPIPLESGGLADVMLTNFVVSNGDHISPNVQERHHTPSEGFRRAHSIQASRLSRVAVIQGGSVRVTNNPPSGNLGHARAVDNQYAFV